MKLYGNRWVWTCLCDCGNIVKEPTFKLGGNKGVKSCGCLVKDTSHKIGKNNKKNDYEVSDSNERSLWRSLYIKWIDIKKRCYNPKTPNYKDYGCRGISVCQEWKDSFQTFKQWAISQGYNPNIVDRTEQTIDRIDVNGSYEPDNCRLVSSKVQANNTRRNLYIEYGGQKYSLEQLSDTLGCKVTYLRNQYYHNKKYQEDHDYFISEVVKKLNRKEVK